MDPTSFLVTVHLQAYLEDPDAIAARVRACVESHPSLSMRVDAVDARKTTDAPAACEADGAVRPCVPESWSKQS